MEDSGRRQTECTLRISPMHFSFDSLLSRDISMRFSFEVFQFIIYSAHYNRMHSAVQFSKSHSIEIYFIFVVFNLDTKWDWRTMKKLWLALIKWKKTNNASKRSMASKQLRHYSIRRTLCGTKFQRNPEWQKVVLATKVPMLWPRTNHRQVSAPLICRLPRKI